MGKSISVHNGTAAHRAHNIRDLKVAGKQEHIDPALSHNNETLVDIEPREAYRQLFGEALERYNAKQKRPERQISDYFEHTKADKQKNPVYEVIIQVGDKIDTGINAPTERTIIKDFIDGWKGRNPNLVLIGAYIHADEPDGTLHAHLDYVPVATGYKRGLEVQSALTKALGQQGFDTERETITEMVTQPDGTEKAVKTVLTAQSRWQESERQALTAICNTYEVEVERKKQKVDHLDTPEYKAKQDSLNKLDAEIEKKREQLRVTQSNMRDLNKRIAERNSLHHEIRQLSEKESLRATEARQECQKLVGDIETLSNEKNGLQGKIDALQTSLSDNEVYYNKEIERITEIANQKVEKVKTDMMQQIEKIEAQAQGKRNEIVAELQGVTNQAKELKQQYATEIMDLRSERDLLREVLQTEEAAGAKQFGSLDEMRRHISQARQEKQDSTMLNALVKFLQENAPGIWAKFQQFYHGMTQGRGQSQSRNEPNR